MKMKKIIGWTAMMAAIALLVVGGRWLQWRLYADPYELVSEEELLADAYCETDDDCVEVNLSCNGCVCYGQGVNKVYKEKYDALHDQQCWAPRTEEECHLDCAHEVLKCYENRCQFIDAAYLETL